MDRTSLFIRNLYYISTLQKQGLNVWHGLVSVFRGDITMPSFCCWVVIISESIHDLNKP